MKCQSQFAEKKTTTKKKTKKNKENNLSDKSKSVSIYPNIVFESFIIIMNKRNTSQR